VKLAIAFNNFMDSSCIDLFSKSHTNSCLQTTYVYIVQLISLGVTLKLSSFG